MKFYYFLLFILVFVSCKENNNVFNYFSNRTSKFTFRIKKQIIEYLDKNQADTILYYYKKNNDFFPYLVEIKRLDSIVSKKVYHLNEWDIPFLEEVYNSDTLFEKYSLKYSPKNYYILEKNKYLSNDRINFTQKYNYDENHFLRHIELTFYSNNKKFINKDSTNAIEYLKYIIIPDTLCRFKGSVSPFLLLSRHRKYAHYDKKTIKTKKQKKIKEGDLLYSLDTYFDEKGFPTNQVYHIYNDRDTIIKRIWFKCEFDGLNFLRAIVPFRDSLLSQIDNDHYALFFSYDCNGIVDYISKNYYNLHKKKFINPDTIIQYKWFQFEENNLQNFNFIKSNYKIWNYNKNDANYEILECKVIKFEQDEVIEEFYKYNSNISQRRLNSLKPFKRIKTLIEKIKLKQYKGL